MPKCLNRHISLPLAVFTFSFMSVLATCSKANDDLGNASLRPNVSVDLRAARKESSAIQFIPSAIPLKLHIYLANIGNNSKAILGSDFKGTGTPYCYTYGNSRWDHVSCIDDEKKYTRAVPNVWNNISGLNDKLYFSTQDDLINDGVVVGFRIGLMHGSVTKYITVYSIEGKSFLTRNEMCVQDGDVFDQGDANKVNCAQKVSENLYILPFQGNISYSSDAAYLINERVDYSYEIVNLYSLFDRDNVICLPGLILDLTGRWTGPSKAPPSAPTESPEYYSYRADIISSANSTQSATYVQNLVRTCFDSSSETEN